MGLAISRIVREEGGGISLEVKDSRLRDVRMASRRLFVDGVDRFRALIIRDRRRPTRERRSEAISGPRISSCSNVLIIRVAGQADLVMELTCCRGTVVMLSFYLR